MLKTPETELELLCRWLNSGINRKNNKSDQIFTAYYNTIKKELLPYLENTLSLKGTGLAEEFFQETMVKILNLCIERPQTAKRIEELTRELDAFDINNSFFKKRAYTWTTDVKHWAEEAISFPSEHSQTKSPELDDKVKHFNGKMNPLENEGIAILDCLADNIANIQEKEFIEITTNIIGMPKIGKQKPKPNLLSKICIPTSALLKTMATNEAKDHWKKRSTKFEKTLESERNNESELFDHKEKHLTGYGKALEPDKKEWGRLHKNILESHQERVHQQNQGTVINETDKIQEAIKFLLQAPIRNAETQLREATGKQEILRSQNRLDKARTSYNKHLEILAMIENDYTQEQMAIELDMTRDQVRYSQPQIKVLLELLKGDLS